MLTPETTATAVPAPTSTRTATITPMPTAVLTSTAPPTPDNRVANPENRHLYLLVEVPASWQEASDQCISLGARLVTIQSADENRFVSRMANDMWLGATDHDREGDWVWVTGEPWDYSNWYPGEPNNCCPAQYCGPQECTPESYLTIDSTGQWNDTPDGQMQFVCEWEDGP